jgi:ADP-ribosylglycohydrolase
MRAPILGVCFANELNRMAELARISTVVTHTDPKATAGALAIAWAASLATQRRRIQSAEYVDGLRRLQREDDDAAIELMRALELAAESVESGEMTKDFAASIGLEQGVSGYMYHTVPVVIHAWLANQFDYPTTIGQLIECGGDTDSTAAIAGAIAGAQCGVEGIPPHLVNGILDWPRTRSWLRRLADAIAVAAQTHETSRPPSLPLPFTLMRNLFFLPIVLGHGFRRLLPPY